MSLSRELSWAARRFADRNSEKINAAPSARLLRATVATVTAGAASDGNALVTVTWRGENCPVADYPDSYTPAPGHRVLCALVGDQLSILHRGIGYP